MKILFKSNYNVFYLENGEIKMDNLYPGMMDIQHLNQVKPLFNIKSIDNNFYKVMYRYGEFEILCSINDGYYFISKIDNRDIIDYTESNIEKLKEIIYEGSSSQS